MHLVLRHCFGTTKYTMIRAVGTRVYPVIYVHMYIVHPVIYVEQDLAHNKEPQGRVGRFRDPADLLDAGNSLQHGLAF